MGDFDFLKKYSQLSPEGEDTYNFNPNPPAKKKEASFLSGSAGIGAASLKSTYTPKLSDFYKEWNENIEHLKNDFTGIIHKTLYDKIPVINEYDTAGVTKSKRYLTYKYQLKKPSIDKIVSAASDIAGILAMLYGAGEILSAPQAIINNKTTRTIGKIGDVAKYPVSKLSQIFKPVVELEDAKLLEKAFIDKFGKEGDSLDQAYRRIILQVHPDRAGQTPVDPKIATKINNVYRDIENAQKSRTQITKLLSHLMYVVDTNLGESKQELLNSKLFVPISNFNIKPEGMPEQELKKTMKALPAIIKDTKPTSVIQKEISEIPATIGAATSTAAAPVKASVPDSITLTVYHAKTGRGAMPHVVYTAGNPSYAKQYGATVKEYKINIPKDKILTLNLKEESKDVDGRSFTFKGRKMNYMALTKADKAFLKARGVDVIDVNLPGKPHHEVIVLDKSILGEGTKVDTSNIPDLEKPTFEKAAPKPKKTIKMNKPITINVTRAGEKFSNESRGGTWLEVEQWKGEKNPYFNHFSVGGRKVYRGKVTLQNPYKFIIPDIKAEGEIPLKLYEEVIGEKPSTKGMRGANAEKYYAKIEKKIADKLKSLGYDGVILYNKVGVNEYPKQVFSFNPDQVNLSEVKVKNPFDDLPEVKPNPLSEFSKKLPTVSPDEVKTPQERAAIRKQIVDVQAELRQKKPEGWEKMYDQLKVMVDKFREPTAKRKIKPLVDVKKLAERKDSFVPKVATKDKYFLDLSKVDVHRNSIAAESRLYALLDLLRQPPIKKLLSPYAKHFIETFDDEDEILDRVKGFSDKPIDNEEFRKVVERLYNEFRSLNTTGVYSPPVGEEAAAPEEKENPTKMKGKSPTQPEKKIKKINIVTPKVEIPHAPDPKDEIIDLYHVSKNGGIKTLKSSMAGENYGGKSGRVYFVAPSLGATMEPDFLKPGMHVYHREVDRSLLWDYDTMGYKPSDKDLQKAGYKGIKYNGNYVVLFGDPRVEEIGTLKRNTTGQKIDASNFLKEIFMPKKKEAPPNLSQKTKRIAKEIAEWHNKNNGSTIDIHNGKNYVKDKKGYAVSVFPEAGETLPRRTLTPEDIEKFIARNKEILKNKHVTVGTYWDQGAQGTDIDASIVVLDKKLAIKLGKAFNQKSIFDIANLEPIEIGGTGENKGKFIPIPDRLRMIDEITGEKPPTIVRNRSKSTAQKTDKDLFKDIPSDIKTKVKRYAENLAKFERQPLSDAHVIQAKKIATTPPDNLVSVNNLFNGDGVNSDYDIRLQIGAKDGLNLKMAQAVKEFRQEMKFLDSSVKKYFTKSGGYLDINRVVQLTRWIKYEKNFHHKNGIDLLDLIDAARSEGVDLPIEPNDLDYIRDINSTNIDNFKAGDSAKLGTYYGKLEGFGEKELWLQSFYKLNGVKLERDDSALPIRPGRQGYISLDLPNEIIKAVQTIFKPDDELPPDVRYDTYKRIRNLEVAINIGKQTAEKTGRRLYNLIGKKPNKLFLKTVDDYLDNPEKYKDKFNALPDKYKLLAEQIKTNYKVLGEAAQRDKFIESLRDQYTMHLYKDDTNMVLKQLLPNGGKLGTKLRMSKTRVYATKDEARKAGLHPIDNPILKMEIYIQQFFMAKANREFIKSLMTLVDKDGVPLIMRKPGAEAGREIQRLYRSVYQPLNNRNLSQFMWVGEIDDKGMFVKVPLKASPPLAKILNSNFSPFQTPSRAKQDYLIIRGLIKRGVFFNPFIHGANIEGVRSVISLMSIPFPKNKIKVDDWQQFAIKSGLQYKNYSHEIMRQILSEVAPLKSDFEKAAAGVIQFNDKVLWDTIVPEAQLAAFKNTANMLKSLTKWDDQKIGRVAADYLNPLFGTIPDSWFPRVWRDWGSVLFLAFKWTASNLDLMVKSITLGHRGLGTATMLPEEKALIGKLNLAYFLSSLGLLLAAVNFIQIAYQKSRNQMIKDGILKAKPVKVHSTFSNEIERNPLNIFAIDTGTKNKMGQEIYLTFPLYRWIRDAASWIVKPNSTLLNKMEPLLKTGIELVFNFSSWQRREIVATGDKSIAGRLRAYKNAIIYAVKAVTPSSYFVGDKTPIEWVAPFFGAWVSHGSKGGKYMTLYYEYLAEKKDKFVDVDKNIDKLLSEGKIHEAIQYMKETHRYSTYNSIANRVLNYKYPLHRIITNNDYLRWLIKHGYSYKDLLNEYKKEIKENP